MDEENQGKEGPNKVGEKKKTDNNGKTGEKNEARAAKDIKKPQENKSGRPEINIKQASKSLLKDKWAVAGKGGKIVKPPPRTAPSCKPEVNKTDKPVKSPPHPMVVQSTQEKPMSPYQAVQPVIVEKPQITKAVTPPPTSNATGIPVWKSMDGFTPPVSSRSKFESPTVTPPSTQDGDWSMPCSNSIGYQLFGTSGNSWMWGSVYTSRLESETKYEVDKVAYVDGSPAQEEEKIEQSEPVTAEINQEENINVQCLDVGAIDGQDKIEVEAKGAENTATNEQEVKTKVPDPTGEEKKLAQKGNRRLEMIVA